MVGRTQIPTRAARLVPETTLCRSLGLAGVMAVTLLLVGVAVLVGKWPPVPEPRQQDLPRADLKQLAGRTEIWLEAQRRALPAPARTLVDGIGVQLDLLAQIGRAHV